ncbi:F-box protein SKIP22-like [Gastrolobium bilobum]|uniref:F-box protein SKIP22-like n=1 Tax=Gastrolobium bilobum TaxID=150636 RepID=UPI002AB141EE|nr:F-box protein SKIP22-like [Gastrolobium bilobum]
MKLRLRSLESKETLKIEVPNSCSLKQLRDIISRAISSTSSSSSSLHLSLNRKDEIGLSSPHKSLDSIGIIGGDLVFYTLNPNAFSHKTLLHKPTPQEETNSSDVSTIQDSPSIDMSDAPSIPAAEKSPTLDAAEAETMDMVDGSDEAVLGRSDSEPSFMKRVVREVLGTDVTDLKLLVFAVHAVILESGFVRADQVSGVAVSGSHLLDDWPSGSSSMISLRYTLPEILNSGASQTVNLKFQTLGHLVNVCGSLSDDAGSRLHVVHLDKCKFARPVKLMLANSESKASFNDGGDDECGKQVFELWKMVKDRLALPLLIDLCEKAGLDLPPCFMRLPMELKLMILEHLPGVDLAKVACTCSELRYLSSSNELWEHKFEEEFGGMKIKGRLFKDLFALQWETKKKSERGLPLRQYGRYFSRRRDPIPYGIHPIWGGEYGRASSGYLPRWTYLPQCHLGGEFHR